MSSFSFSIPALLWLLPLLLPGFAWSHEVWIEPAQYVHQPGAKVIADVKIGQKFKGSALAYIQKKTVDSGFTQDGEPHALASITGDVPAVTAETTGSGLHTFWLHTVPDRLHYTKFGKFEDFLNDKGLSHILSVHRNRGLPDTDFVEAFSRCSKSLVQIGEPNAERQVSADNAIVVGMPIELVAEGNPYALGTTPDAALPVRLLWKNAALADTQITVFNKRADDDVTITKLRTDGNGRASVPLHGGGAFLIDAVHIIPWDEQPKDAWHSYWASLTFAIDPTR